MRHRAPHFLPIKNRPDTDRWCGSWGNGNP
jgi:hypothetical protein